MATENESPVATEKEQGEYSLHIRLSREMQPALKDAAELAYRMGETFYRLGAEHPEEEVAGPDGI